jgi:hypothetical protein
MDVNAKRIAAVAAEAAQRVLEEARGWEAARLADAIGAAVAAGFAARDSVLERCECCDEDQVCEHRVSVRGRRNRPVCDECYAELCLTQGHAR